MRRRPALVIAAIAAALVMSACSDAADPVNFEPNGLQDKEVIDVFQTGAKATLDATDVIATGALPVDKVKTTVETRFGGTKAQATMTTSKYKYEVITNGGLIFVRGDEAFWIDQVGRVEASKIGTKWARTLIDGPLGQFAFFVDKNSYFRASGRIELGDAADVNGRPTISVVDPPSNTDSTWWFATTGDPVLMKYKTGKSTSFEYDYSQTVIVDIPAVEDTVDATTIDVPASKSD